MRCRPEKKEAKRRTHESCFKREQPCSQTVTGATRRQRAFFSFPPLQQRPTSGPNAVRSVGHLNAVHKGFRLPHRTLDRELRTTVLMSGLSFSFEYAALAPAVNLFHSGHSENRQIVVDKSIATGSPKASSEPQIPLKTASYTAYSRCLHAVCG